MKNNQSNNTTTNNAWLDEAKATLTPEQYASAEKAAKARYQRNLQKSMSKWGLVNITAQLEFEQSTEVTDKNGEECEFRTIVTPSNYDPNLGDYYVKPTGTDASIQRVKSALYVSMPTDLPENYFPMVDGVIEPYIHLYEEPEKGMPSGCIGVIATMFWKNERAYQTRKGLARRVNFTYKGIPFDNELIKPEGSGYYLLTHEDDRLIVGAYADYKDIDERGGAQQERHFILGVLARGYKLVIVNKVFGHKDKFQDYSLSNLAKTLEERYALPLEQQYVQRDLAIAMAQEYKKRGFKVGKARETGRVTAPVSVSDPVTGTTILQAAPNTTATIKVGKDNKEYPISQIMGYYNVVEVSTGNVAKSLSPKGILNGQNAQTFNWLQMIADDPFGYRLEVRK